MKKDAFDSLAFLPLDSEVASLVRSFDWSRCPLGAPQHWPPTLIALVNSILLSEVPMIVAWGPRLLSIYSDAYQRQFLGNKHPESFAQPFQEIWSEIGTEIISIVERAGAGKTTYSENAPFSVNRNGYKEQFWATFSHSPILDDGIVVGTLGMGMDTTAQVLAEKRQHFQLAFIYELRGLTNPHDITAAATKLLGEYLAATQVFYSETDDLADNFFTKATWSAVPLPPLPSGGRLSDYGEEIIANLRSGMPLIIDEIHRDRRTIPYAMAYEGLNIRSLLVVPLVKSGRLIAALNVSRLEPYRWTKEDVSATQDVAERTWAAVERARAEAAVALERDRSRDILENMDEGFVLLDRDFRVVQINAGALRLEQRSASEFVGRTAWEAWPGMEAWK